VAYRCAADRLPCELVVCDAHRVVRHELINVGAGSAGALRHTYAACSDDCRAGGLPVRASATVP